MCVLRYPTTRAVLERNDCGTPLSITITMVFVCERLHRMTSKLRPPVRRCTPASIETARFLLGAANRVKHELHAHELRQLAIHMDVLPLQCPTGLLNLHYEAPSSKLFQATKFRQCYMAMATGVPTSQTKGKEMPHVRL
jgi:hypothetical protein